MANRRLFIRVVPVVVCLLGWTWFHSQIGYAGQSDLTTRVKFPRRIRVTFINPGGADPRDPTGGFWRSVTSFMQAAARDLSIDLEVLYAQRNHLLMKDQAREVVFRKNPPDYLIVVNEKLVAGDMIKNANKAGVDVFLILNNFTGPQADEMGEPRQKYKHWIGSLIPDNQFAGYKIAQSMIEKTKADKTRFFNKKLNMIGIAGDRVTLASVERVHGLCKCLHENINIDIKQIFYANWRKDKAFFIAKSALKRYPDINLIWAANDPMAIGAMEAVVSSGKQPGKDVLIGGLNWDLPILTEIEKGNVAVSLGGHFMTGGWALVLIYDYDHGIDFKTEGLQLMYQIFRVMDRDNINRFQNTFGDRNWDKIDFKQYSKYANPVINNYEFGLESYFLN